MGVAGEVVQWLELAKDGDIDGRTEGLLHLVDRGDLVAQQKRAQFIGAIGNGSHNVIVPTREGPNDRYYNKLWRARPPPTDNGELPVFQGCERD